MICNEIPVFFVPNSDSERNSESFLFRETGGIPTKQWSIPSCSVFRGIILLLEIGNPTAGGRRLIVKQAQESCSYRFLNPPGERKQARVISLNIKSVQKRFKPVPSYVLCLDRYVKSIRARSILRILKIFKTRTFAFGGT